MAGVEAAEAGPVPRRSRATETKIPPASSRLGFRDLFGAVRPRAGAPPFVDLFEDYDEYHSHVETGNLLRAQLIAPWIDEGSSVLDAGCGDGRVAEFLRSARKVSIRGIEGSGVAAQKARGRGLDVIVQDLDTDPRLPGPVDYVLFVEVLEHLRSPHRVLKAATAIARKGVIVTLPNSGWFADRVQMAMGFVPRQSFTHLHAWSQRDFLAFCAQLGLVIRGEKFLASDTTWRANLVAAFPNLLARQLAFLIAPLR